MSRVAVIGAGITGLTCASELAKRGHQVVVYERSDNVGGLAGSFRRGAFAWDYGPHEFCTLNPRLIQLLEEVLGDDLLIREARVAQCFRGQYVDYPMHPIEVLRHLGTRLGMKVVAEVLVARVKEAVWISPDFSFENWVVKRFGRTLYDHYFAPYTEKVWGISPQHLDPRTASDRIAFNSIFDYAEKAFRYYVLKQEDPAAHSPLKLHFRYPRGGIGTLSAALSNRCSLTGRVTIRTGYSISDLGPYLDQMDYVVSTIPLTDLLRIMGHESAPLRFRSMVFVFLQVYQDQVMPYHWSYYPDKDICFQRVTEFGHFDAGMCPSGTTGLCLELPCFAGDEVWNASEAQTISRAMDDLRKVGLGAGLETATWHIARQSHAYPVQVAGYQEAVASLLEPIRRTPRLVSTGRQGLYKYCNMDECMEMALDVAEQIDAGVKEFDYHLEPIWLGRGVSA